MNSLSAPLVALIVLALAGCARPAARTTDTSGAPAVLWRANGAAERQRQAPPAAPFTFVEEDRDGDSPKFLVTDARGAQWQVKLGPEAQAETVAVRLVTALGYFADETYFLRQVDVPGVEALKRGHEYLSGSRVRHARFEGRRATIRRGETWDWSRNPFVGTVELDALRALMVLINNYDARTDNNRILEVRAGGRTERRYVVTDLGASFGRVGGMGGRRSKNDVDDYRTSPFIASTGHGHVRFAYRTRPEGWAVPVTVFNPFYVAGERKKERDMMEVPLPAARWLAARLQRLPPATMRAAFEEAGYSPDVAAAFFAALNDRITQLSRL